MTIEKNEKKIIEDFVDLFQISKWEKKVEIFKLLEKKGYHIVKTGFYSPIPTTTDLTDDLFSIKEHHIDWNEEKQVELAKQLASFNMEFKGLINNRFYDMSNSSFAVHDAPVYYGIIRNFKPQLIIEIGRGNSTIISSLAIKKNEIGKIISVDPYSKQKISGKTSENLKMIDEPVQKIPLQLFKELKENDILFIDGSHVSKIGSDVNFMFFEVLPILNRGVLIHIHDVQLPREFPRKWIEEKMIFWNEQYLLHAFLLGNKDFEVLFGNSFMGLKHPKLLDGVYQSDKPPGGGSFWIRKK